MDPKRITVGAQIYSDQLLKLKRQGFSVIINNRPDGEERSQPNSKKIQLEAESLGLDYFYIPVSTLGTKKKIPKHWLKPWPAFRDPYLHFADGAHVPKN